MIILKHGTGDRKHSHSGSTLGKCTGLLIRFCLLATRVTRLFVACYWEVNQGPTSRWFVFCAVILRPWRGATLALMLDQEHSNIDWVIPKSNMGTNGSWYILNSTTQSSNRRNLAVRLVLACFPAWATSPSSSPHSLCCVAKPDLGLTYSSVHGHLRMIQR